MINNTIKLRAIIEMSKLPTTILYLKIEDSKDINNNKIEDGTYYKFYLACTNKYHVSSFPLRALECNNCNKIICSDVFIKHPHLYCMECKIDTTEKLNISESSYVGLRPINSKISIELLDKESYNIIVNNKDPLKIMKLIFESKIKEYHKYNQLLKDKIRPQLYCKDNQLVITKLRDRLFEAFSDKLLKDRKILLWILKMNNIKVPKQVIINCLFPLLTSL